MEPTMTVYDLFAGIGGWDVAAQQLGLDPIGVEIWEPACQTRSAAGLKTLQQSVRDVEIPQDLTGLIASPPCQTFSAAGNGAGRKALATVLEGVWRLGNGFPEAFADGEIEDERTRLVLEPLRWVLQGRPEWTAWEQVPTVLPVWVACADVLRSHGYSVWTGLLHSEQYGVPQTRKRAFLLASRTQHVTAPMPTHSRYHPRDKSRLDEGVLPWVSMAEALGWERCVEVESNYGTGGDPRNRGVRSGDEPFGTVTSKVDRYKVHVRAAGVTGEGRPRHADTPSPTLTGKGTAQNTPGSVRVTVEEALVLQGFPADYPLQGSKTSRYLQVGNAVPPPMAKAALQAVIAP